MEMFTTENGKMIRLMVTAYTITPTVLDTKVNGLKTNNTEEAKKFGQTALNTKVTIKKERNTETENSTGPTDLPTLDNSLITTSMA